MEDKIEVNEYVKTDKGKITKIIGIDEFIDSTTFYETEDNPGYMDLCNENIVNHSKQLIDLIEKDDYVNGYRVTDKYLFAGEKPVLETEGNDTNCKCLCEKDIKTILTKEQYLANCYKVGGEEWD